MFGVFKKSFSESIKMTSDGVIAEIDLLLFEDLIGGKLGEVIKKNEKSHEVFYQYMILLYFISLFH